MNDKCAAGTGRALVVMAALRGGVAERVKGLLRAVGVEEDFVINGGISKNVGVVRRVEQKLGRTSNICFEPQVVRWAHSRCHSAVACQINARRARRPCTHRD